MPSCNEIMCKEGLYTKKNASKWLLKHHPDKGGNTSINVGDIGTCMKNKKFCTRKNKNKSNSVIIIITTHDK